MLTICSFPNYAHRFRLEVEVKDDTNQTVVVLWDETATDLTKSATDLINEIYVMTKESATDPICYFKLIVFLLLM